MTFDEFATRLKHLADRRRRSGLSMSSSDWYDPTETYECAFCGEIINHAGFDPCRVDVEAARDVASEPGLWWFWAHAACVPRAFHPELQAEVAGEYKPGRH